MALESATYIGDLVATNPTGSDNRSDGDDHIRLVKAAIQATLPGLAGRAWRKQTKSGSYTLALTDNMSWINVTSTATMTLPPAATAGNGYCVLIRAGAGVTVTIDADGSELINNALTATIDSLDGALIFCDGTTWAMLWIQNGASTALTDPTLTKPSMTSVRETFVSNASASGGITLDCALATTFDLQLTGNVTSITLSNVPGSVAFMITLRLTQDATGGRTIAWPGSVKWPSAVAPVLSTGAAKTDLISLLTFDGGSSWYGLVAGQNF